MSIVTTDPPAAKYAPLADAARFAGLSVKTIQRQIRSGRLELYRVGTRQLVEIDAVDRLVRSGLVPAATDVATA